MVANQGRTLYKSAYNAMGK